MFENNIQREGNIKEREYNTKMFYHINVIHYITSKLLQKQCDRKKLQNKIPLRALMALFYTELALCVNEIAYFASRLCINYRFIIRHSEVLH